MEPEKRPEDLTSPTPPRGGGPSPRRGDAPQPGEEALQTPSRKARLWAWVGIAFMVFLTIMYAYAFASGSILMY